MSQDLDGLLHKAYETFRFILKTVYNRNECVKCKTALAIVNEHYFVLTCTEYRFPNQLHEFVGIQLNKYTAMDCPITDYTIPL